MRPLRYLATVVFCCTLIPKSPESIPFSQYQYWAKMLPLR